MGIIIVQNFIIYNMHVSSNSDKNKKRKEKNGKDNKERV